MAIPQKDFCGYNSVTLTVLYSPNEQSGNLQVIANNSIAIRHKSSIKPQVSICQSVTPRICLQTFAGIDLNNDQWQLDASVICSATPSLLYNLTYLTILATPRLTRKPEATEYCLQLLQNYTAFETPRLTRKPEATEYCLQLLQNYTAFETPRLTRKPEATEYCLQLSAVYKTIPRSKRHGPTCLSRQP
jgi:hypothetical protein